MSVQYTSSKVNYLYLIFISTNLWVPSSPCTDHGSRLI